MSDTIKRVETFTITIPREVPYLGELAADEQPNSRGYFVRRGNRTVYPTVDRSILVRVETGQGAVGWGETYGIVAPGAARVIIEDLLAEFVKGRDPHDAAVIHEDLYDLMRVRGYTGGFYLDALAAIDIALWDLAGKLSGLPLVKLLGGQRRDKIPAYVSGLPGASLAERVALAAEWQGRGFSSYKFAATAADQGPVAELAALREQLGAEARIAADLHWQHSAAEAAALITQLQPYGLWFAEAPCQTEDQAGQAYVTNAVTAPIAAGEEWRTVYELLPRLRQRCLSIFQPEMGHIGVTQFMQMSRLAQAFHCPVIPHATIGIGLFLTASLHASAALLQVQVHEYQHSVFDQNLRFIEGELACAQGYYTLPIGPGLGVEPSREALELLKRD